MQHISIDSRHNTPLNYFKSLSSPQQPFIVIINAYGIPVEPWQGLIERLQPNFNIIIWELRGIKNSELHNASFVFDIDQHCADLAEIINNENIDKAHLLCWCSGIKPALRFSHQHPEKVASLISIAANLTPYAATPNCHTVWDENMLTLSQMLIEQPESLPIFYDVISDAIDKAMSCDGEIPEGQFGLLKLIQPQYIEQILKPMLNQESMANYLRMIHDYYQQDMSADLKMLNAPSLFLVASDDGIAHPQQSEAICSTLANAQLELIPDSNHYMLIEQPQALSTLIENFVHKVN